MPRRNLSYSKIRGLEDERRLAELVAITPAIERIKTDPTVEIPGTVAQKSVYNFLVKLGVGFEYKFHLQGFDFTAFPEEIYQPTFLLTDYNIIIDVFVSHWSSLPARRLMSKRIDDTSLWGTFVTNGFAVYESGVPVFPESGNVAGKVILWTDTDIFQSLGFLFARDLPELLGPDVIRGPAKDIIEDKLAERRFLEAKQALISSKRIVPKVIPLVPRRIRRLRRQKIDLKSIEDSLKEPKLPKPAKIKFPKFPTYAS